jgi:cardiolipin synthase
LKKELRANGERRGKKRRRFRPFLRPREGRKLPQELWPENVGLLAGALPGGLADPGFRHLLSRIDEAPVLPGNRVEVFFSGAQAFAAMCAAIEDARREILVESYIWRDDATGEAIFQRLASAASGRGVSVRVLADAWGSLRTGARFWDRMRRRGIEVRLFHPLFPRLWYQPFRDHRKILVADRRIAFTGGMNIADEYGGSGGSAGSRPWRDTHARLEGPVAWEMALVFSEGWTRAGGSAIEHLPLEPSEGEGASILVLDSRPLRGHAESASALAAIVGAARRSLWITNAYFAPPRRAVSLLGDAVQRGVDVRLLLAGSTDVPIVRHAGHAHFAGLLERGVRIFEYRDAVLHAKSLVADGLVSVLGSTNLDFRSFRFNAECNLVVFDEATAATLSKAFLDDLDRAEEVLGPRWRSRSLPHRLGDSLARALSPVL